MGFSITHSPTPQLSINRRLPCVAAAIKQAADIYRRTLLTERTSPVKVNKGTILNLKGFRAGDR